MSITGPNAEPTTLVPNCWKKNSSTIIPITIPRISLLPGTKYAASSGTLFNPSIADVTEIGGVIMPSASKVPAPTIAGIASHLP